MRIGGKMIIPYGESEFEIVDFGKGLILIKVRSAYFHGFSEKETAFFRIDKDALEFVQVWKHMTYEANPILGEISSELDIEDLNNDGFKDIRLNMCGKSTTWIWNASKETFDSEDK